MLLFMLIKEKKEEKCENYKMLHYKDPKIFLRQLFHGINKRKISVLLQKERTKLGKSVSLKMKSCKKGNSCCLKVSRENKREEKCSTQQNNAKKANFYLPKIEFPSFAISLIIIFLLSIIQKSFYFANKTKKTRGMKARSVLKIKANKGTNRTIKFMAHKMILILTKSLEKETENKQHHMTVKLKYNDGISKTLLPQSSSTYSLGMFFL